MHTTLNEMEAPDSIIWRIYLLTFRENAYFSNGLGYNDDVI